MTAAAVSLIFLILSLFISSKAGEDLMVSRVPGLESIKISAFLPWNITIKEIEYSRDGIALACEKASLSVSPASLIKFKPVINKIEVIDPHITISLQEESREKNREGEISRGSGDIPPFEIRYLSLKGLAVSYIQEDMEIKTGGYNMGLSINHGGGGLENMQFDMTFAGSSDLLLSWKETRLEIPFVLNIGAREENGSIGLNASAEISEKDKVGDISLLIDLVMSTEKRSLDIRRVRLDGERLPLAELSGSVTFDETYGISSYDIREMNAEIDLAETLELVNDAVKGEIPGRISGTITLNGDAEEDSFSCRMDLKEMRFETDMLSLDGRARLDAEGTKERVTAALDLALDNITINQTGTKLTDFRIEAEARVDDFTEVSEIKVGYMGFKSYGGQFKLQGYTKGLSEHEYDISMKDMTFLNYFDIPLYAKFNGDIKVSGSSSKDISMDFDLKGENIDMRMGKEKLAADSVSFTGNIIMELERRFLYFNELVIKSGDNNRFKIDGYIDDLGRRAVDITLSDSRIDLNDIGSSYSALDGAELSGTVSFNMEASGTLEELKISSENHLDHISYRGNGAALSGIDGEIWFDGTKDDFKAVLDCRIEEGKMDDLKFRGLSLSIPYFFSNKRSPGDEQAGGYRISMEKADYNQYSVEDLDAELSAVNRRFSTVRWAEKCTRTWRTRITVFP